MDFSPPIRCAALRGELAVHSRQSICSNRCMTRNRFRCFLVCRYLSLQFLPHSANAALMPGGGASYWLPSWRFSQSWRSMCIGQGMNVISINDAKRQVKRLLVKPVIQTVYLRNVVQGAWAGLTAEGAREQHPWTACRGGWRGGVGVPWRGLHESRQSIETCRGGGAAAVVLRPR